MSDDDHHHDVFVVWLTNERHLALFPARTISKIFPNLNLQYAASRLEPAQNLCSDFVE